MNKTLSIWVGGILVAAGLLAGCADKTPRLDQKFGEAVNTAKAQQTINPDAPRNADPVAGLDGVAAQNAVDHYDRTYKAPPPPVNVFNIGIGK